MPRNLGFVGTCTRWKYVGGKLANLVENAQKTINNEGSLVIVAGFSFKISKR